MLIAVPSKNRAYKTTTDKVLPNISTFFVNESEAHNYSYLKNIVTVPNEIRGITRTRNWILKQYPNEEIVFLDDDVKFYGYNKVNEYNMKKVQIKDEEFWHNEFRKYFDICYGLKYKIWGIRTESSPKGTYPYKPFIFQTYVTASCMGIINDGEFYFNEEYPVKEDYEICLRHIKKYGGILGVRYSHWENEHWTTEGGCKDYRTYEMEKKAIKMLIKDYPGMVRSATRKNNIFTIQLNF